MFCSVIFQTEDADLIQNPAYGKQKLRYSKKPDRADGKGRYTKPRDEPFYDKAQAAKLPPGDGQPNRRPSDGDRLV